MTIASRCLTEGWRGSKGFPIVLFLVATSSALADDATSKLAEAELKARTMTMEASGPAKKFGPPPAKGWSQSQIPNPAESSVETRPRPVSKRGIAPERLRGILSKCSDQVQQDFFKGASFLNGMWVASPTKEIGGLKKCLGDEGLARLAGLTKSETHFDSACFFTGQCYNKVGWVCNDFDCEYYHNKPGVAREDQGCWMDGDCYNLNNHLCHQNNCQTYR